MHDAAMHVQARARGKLMRKEIAVKQVAFPRNC